MISADVFSPSPPGGGGGISNINILALHACGALSVAPTVRRVVSLNPVGNDPFRLTPKAQFFEAGSAFNLAFASLIRICNQNANLDSDGKRCMYKNYESARVFIFYSKKNASCLTLYFSSEKFLISLYTKVPIRLFCADPKSSKNQHKVNAEIKKLLFCHSVLQCGISIQIMRLKVIRRKY